MSYNPSRRLRRHRRRRALGGAATTVKRYVRGTPNWRAARRKAAAAR